MVVFALLREYLNVFVHSTADIVAELIYLFSDIFQKGIARPAADHHDAKGGTSSNAMAIAPPALMECVPKSPFSKPRLAYPIDSAALSIASMIFLLVICSIRLFLQTADTGVLSSAPGYDRILCTIAAQVLTGHMIS